MIKIYDVIYKKKFEYKDQAETFINNHKKQGCFELCFEYPCNWIVIKTKLINNK